MRDMGLLFDREMLDSALRPTVRSVSGSRASFKQPSRRLLCAGRAWESDASAHLQVLVGVRTRVCERPPHWAVTGLR